jgi:predicted O-linked N-acetylglucosamine transferase (SPINDLY family)
MNAIYNEFLVEYFPLHHNIPLSIDHAHELLLKGNWADAIAVCQGLIQHHPQHTKAWELWAELLEKSNHPELALQITREWTRAQRDYLPAHIQEFRRSINLCDWTTYEYLQRLIVGNINYMPGALMLGESALASPFLQTPLLSKCSQMYAMGLVQNSPPQPLHRSHSLHLASGRRIRVGFLGGNYSNQATTYLMVGFIEAHDRNRFEFIGIDYGHDDQSVLRKRIIQGFDQFYVLTHLNHADLAEQIAQLALDVLFYIDGVGSPRFAVLAFRPAPIQISYLYFPGPLTAPFLDGMIADEWVIPNSQEPGFGQTIYRLGCCYQPNDPLRYRPVLRDRRALHLPTDRFIFANFNASYKITPYMFQLWCTILHACPESVLLLSIAHASAADNLRREAFFQGIAPDRLLFSPLLDNQRHLDRLAHVDLILDTFPYGAHTGTSDALWAGTPVVSLSGEQFASRVAGSLLRSVGLGHFIVEHAQAYVDLACALYHSRNQSSSELQSVKEHLRSNRDSFSIFDATSYARHFENTICEILATHAL